ncbi:MAG: M56 family metallopeptidase [Bacteroidales bacterium]
MTPFILYMVKVASYIAGFYLIYFLFLSRDTMYDRNRIYLVVVSATSFLLPFLTISLAGESSTLAYFGKTLSEIIVVADGNGVSGVGKTTRSFDLSNVIPLIYKGGIIFFTMKLLADISIISWMILTKRQSDSRIIYLSNINTAGFSVLGYIFLNKSLPRDEAEQIIRHEQTHLNHRHSYDIILIEVIKIFQWFNPAIHLLNRSLRAIHEFQADEGCLKSGIPVINYQTMLLNNLLKTRLFLTSNSFSNPSLLRKRIVMMSRVRSGWLANLKMLLVIPVAFIMLSVLPAFRPDGISSRDNGINNKNMTPVFEIYQSAAIIKPGVKFSDAPPPPPPPPPVDENDKSTNAAIIEEIKTTNNQVINEPKNESVPQEVFVVVEEMPKFPGGEQALMEYIYSNVQYPETAKENGIMGRVIVKFTVTHEGSISNATVLKGVDPSLDAEAIRVIMSLPKWTPGKQGGKPVNVWYNIPVTFQLK